MVFAFAKRALARGDDPDEVIRRIADYRAEEKHPNYARYTVEKAQAALQGKSLSSAPTFHGIDPGRNSISVGRASWSIRLNAPQNFSAQGESATSMAEDYGRRMQRVANF